MYTSHIRTKDTTRRIRQQHQISHDYVHRNRTNANQKKSMDVEPLTLLGDERASLHEINHTIKQIMASFLRYDRDAYVGFFSGNITQVRCSRR